jgi:hypothetical protein
MRRLAILASAVVVVSGCALSACGGGHNHGATTRTVVSRPVIHVARTDEVLSVSGLGVFEGRCPRRARSWSLHFANVDEATDTVSYRVGTGARRTVNVDPSNAITFRLVPNAGRTHEPADRFVAPIGQGRGLANATTVPTTAPLQATM